MFEPIKPEDEFARVTELQNLRVLDTPPEERFDRVTRIAQRMFGVNIALVSLIDHDRQWFKSRQGLDAVQTPRDISFCGHAILSDEVLVVQDTGVDPRFADNPLVTGPLGIRFYAGMPLKGPNGYRIGTLCLIDKKPRTFSAEDAAALADLAAIVADQLANKELIMAVKSAQESGVLLRQITDTVPALIAYRDRDERFVFHNKAYGEILGREFDQIQGATVAELISPQAYGPVHDKADEVLRGCPVRFERTYVTRTGEDRIYDIQYFPRYGDGAEAGTVIGYFSLGADITELKRIDRMKTEFISIVSHELRSPLTSIRGSLGLMAGGVAGELSDAAKSLVDIAKNNCERLIRLINDILDSEKIESGKMRLDLQVVNMGALVQQAVGHNEGFAVQHGVTVQVQAHDETLQVKIDADRGIQVLTNLLSNAVKFSPAQGIVEVKVQRVGSNIRVEVIDAGEGVSEEFQDRIFQKFSQADSSDSRQKGGTGLGLNISQALVEKMGGQIGFTSTTGAGSTFFFEFSEWQEPVAPLANCSETVPAVRPRILVCESDPDVARLICMMLGKAGFDSEVAHSAEQAFECIARSAFVALTVDLSLSGQKGRRLHQCAAQRRKNAPAPRRRGFCVG